MLFIEHILSLIAPHMCVGCQKEGAVICKDCIQKMPSPPLACIFCGSNNAHQNLCAACVVKTGMDSVLVFTMYEGLAQKLLCASKFERASAGLTQIAEMVATLSAPEGVITYLPTANQRVRQRGYDHARRIARDVSRLKRKPFLSLIVRINNERQAGASALTRTMHMQNAFRITETKNLKDQHVIVIDDVITTGASMTAAAKLLKQAGAAKVHGMAFAWTPPKKDPEIH
jgi:ComF family protein